ncbi:hypothetical protein scyTo_0009273 [Scyliorhinus torazame]|uniref:Uncharacterized protein n=1 Tax=Scyliorhinus torazame TaxID=75743 RepID=A0A401NJL2_SCYTO|nr:hypothetical protein [Scyliorhinus torazame]
MFPSNLPVSTCFPLACDGMGITWGVTPSEAGTPPCLQTLNCRSGWIHHIEDGGKLLCGRNTSTKRPGSGSQFQFPEFYL